MLSTTCNLITTSASTSLFGIELAVLTENLHPASIETENKTVVVAYVKRNDFDWKSIKSVELLACRFIIQSVQVLAHIPMLSWWEKRRECFVVLPWPCRTPHACQQHSPSSLSTAQIKWRENGILLRKSPSTISSQKSKTWSEHSRAAGSDTKSPHTTQPRHCWIMSGWVWSGGEMWLYVVGGK